MLLNRAATVSLDWDVRQKSRFDATDSQGRALGVFLPRGAVVRGGDVLVAEDGSLIAVQAAPQPVLVVTHCTRARLGFRPGARRLPPGQPPCAAGAEARPPEARTRPCAGRPAAPDAPDRERGDRRPVRAGERRVCGRGRWRRMTTGITTTMGTTPPKDTRTNTSTSTRQRLRARPSRSRARRCRTSTGPAASTTTDDARRTGPEPSTRRLREHRRPPADRHRLLAPSLLQLIWLASPALPVGGFSYSEGLEAAVECGPGRHRGRRQRTGCSTSCTWAWRAATWRWWRGPSAPGSATMPPTSPNSTPGSRPRAKATSCASRPSRWAARWSSG